MDAARSIGARSKRVQLALERCSKLSDDLTIEPDIVAINRRFYDALWWKARLQRPERFNTWPLISSLLPSAPMRLELGPGLRPKLPIAGTYFIDISEPAVDQLNRHGGLARLGEISALPFGDATFDLVCAFDVIEHAENDSQVFAELSRVLKEGGTLLFSVPIDPALWTVFDDWVGHKRRYEPPALLAELARHGLTVEQSAVFGMAPSNPRLASYGLQWLERHRNWAMFWYNWVGMPLALWFQKRLKLSRGVIDMTSVDEILFVCRRQASS
jgi:SAM-dependent methyltransferase